MADALEAKLRRWERKLDSIRLDLPAVEALAADYAPGHQAPAEKASRTGRPPETPPSSGAERPTDDRRQGSRPAPSQRALGLAGAGVIALACAWLGLRRGLAPAEIHAAFALPLTQATGLVIRGEAAYSADPRRLLLYAIETQAGRVLSIRKFPNPNVSGLAWGKDCLWSADADSGSIYQHELDATHSLRRVYANPERKPQALYWDGKTLWVADTATETVFRYAAGESLNVLQQFALPGVFAVGIHVSGDVLWALDGWTRKVCRYRLKPIPVLLDVLETDAWLPAGSRVGGMAVHGPRLWITAGSPETLHRFDWERLPLRRAPGGAEEDQISSGSLKR